MRTRHTIAHAGEAPPGDDALSAERRGDPDATARRCERTTYVAGYDGSSRGRAVVARAAVEAGPAGCVVVVHVYRLPHDSLGSPYSERALSRTRGRAERAIAELVEQDRELPDCDYVVDLIGGSQVDALARAADTHQARAIVVAKRWKGRPSTALRSMARSLARRTSIPIIAVPRDWCWTAPTDAAGRRGSVGRARPLPDPSLWW